MCLGYITLEAAHTCKAWEGPIYKHWAHNKAALYMIKTLTIACSILLSMATTLAPEELKEAEKCGFIGWLCGEALAEYCRVCVMKTRLSKIKKTKPEVLNCEAVRRKYRNSQGLDKANGGRRLWLWWRRINEPTFRFILILKTNDNKLPIVNPDWCALLPEHRGQKRYREIPQLTNAKIHRHSITLGIHATPSIKTPTGGTAAVQTGNPAV